MNNRYKNPYFWIGLVSVIFTAMGVSISELTSWEVVRDAFMDLIKNPFMIISTLLAIIGVFLDPTSKGLKDDIEILK